MPFSTNDFYFPPYKGRLEVELPAGLPADPYATFQHVHGGYATDGYRPSGPSGNPTGTSNVTIANVPDDEDEPSLNSTAYWQDQPRWHHATGEPSTSAYDVLPYAGPQYSVYRDFQEQGAGMTPLAPIADICQSQHASLTPWHISATPDVNLQSAGPSTFGHEQSTMIISSMAGPTVAQSLLSMEEEIQKIKNCRIWIYFCERKLGSVPVEKAVKVLEETNLIGGIWYLEPSGDPWLKRLESYTNAVANLLGGGDFIALLFGRACDACKTTKVRCNRDESLKCLRCQATNLDCTTGREMKRRGRPPRDTTVPSAGR